MAFNMGTPTQTPSFSGVAIEMNLWVDIPIRNATMLRTVPDLYVSIRAHRRNQVRVLWLITRFVDFTRVVDLLDNVKFNLHGSLLCSSTAISTNLAPLLVVILCGRTCFVWKLYVGDLEVVFGCAGCMCPDQ